METVESDSTRTLDDDDERPRHPLANGEAPAANETVGRYRIVERLGAGGMGVVYLAHDPSLDRQVALKVLHRGRDRVEGQAQLVAEAKALARLQHPNVVTVHDVGVADGLVYVAMERIEGRTLAAWIEDAGPTWRERVAAFIAAGRGLAAAHAAGIVHRDFKPENVLVGGGRVCVADFGLARSVDAGDDGKLAGTPRYMAPEQHDGGAISAATDQYAFCVALWWALHGRAPFDGASVAELAASKRAAAIVEPAASPAPRWLLALVRRGLAAAPDARHPSMDALVAALERGLARRRRVVAAVAALGLLATGAAAAASFAGASGDGPTCDGGADELAAAWSPETRRADLARLAALDEHGATLAPRLAARLDAFAAAWTDAHRNACRAHRRGAQSADLLDRRMACLGRGKAAFAGVAEVIAGATAATLPSVAQAASELPDLAACSDLAALVGDVPRPAPAQRAQADAIAAAVERARIQIAAGRFVEARTQAMAAVEEARALGYAPLLARALLTAGHAGLNIDTGRAAAVPVLGEATRVAIEIGDDDVAVEAWARRAWAAGTQSQTPAEAPLAGLELVEATASRPRVSRFARALLHNNLGSVELARGDRDRARERFRQALELARDVTGPGAVELVNVRSNLALVVDNPGPRDALFAEAEAALAAELGPEHPDYARARYRRALWIDEPRRSAELLAPACELLQRHRRARPDFAIACWTDLGLLTDALGDCDAALAALAHATATGLPAATEAAGYHALWSGDVAGAALRFGEPLAAASPSPDEPWWRAFERAKLELGAGRALRAAGERRRAIAQVERAIVDLTAVTRAYPSPPVARRLAAARAELAALSSPATGFR